MKNFVRISFVLLLVVMAFGSTAQAQSPKAVFDKMAKAMGAGDAATLSTMFNSQVEITLPDTDKSYSAQQAQFVLKEFFAQNPASGYVQTHAGNSGATHYATGTLSTSKGDFDTNVFVKNVGGKFLITQLRIEAE